jgi:NH3-dependent NAD+ synthetase
MIIEPSLLAAKISDWISSFNKNIVIAVSGGPSSTLLAYLAIQSNKNVTIFHNSLSNPKLIQANHVKLSYSNNIEYFNAIRKYADENDCITLSACNRNRGHIQRLHKKFGDGMVDAFPLYGLYFSEIIELIKLFEDINYVHDKDHDMIEWCDRDNEKTNIIKSETLPNLSKDWFRYSFVQKQFVASLHQREKVTRHKALEKFPNLNRLDLKELVL